MNYYLWLILRPLKKKKQYINNNLIYSSTSITQLIPNSSIDRSITTTNMFIIDHFVNSFYVQ